MVQGHQFQETRTAQRWAQLLWEWAPHCWRCANIHSITAWCGCYSSVLRCEGTQRKEVTKDIENTDPPQKGRRTRSKMYSAQRCAIAEQSGFWTFVQTSDSIHIHCCLLHNVINRPKGGLRGAGNCLEVFHHRLCWGHQRDLSWIPVGRLCSSLGTDRQVSCRS